jgi:predicted PurR-regulated permease PerM
MSLMEIIGVLAAILGLLVLVGRVVYPIWIGTKTIVEWLEKFRRDWEGEDAEPGRDRVPGVMERLNKLDGELSHNGGSSLKDAVERIEKHLGTR